MRARRSAGPATDREIAVVAAVLDAGPEKAPAHHLGLSHRDLGTIERGAVRFSLGAFNTADDVDRAIEAMRAIPHGALPMTGRHVISTHDGHNA